MSTDIETAFHASLDRLLRGEATLDACVAEYPGHEERLRDMLVVALDLQALAPLPLDRPTVERGARLIDDELQRLRARNDQQPEPASAWERLAWWFPRFMPVRMAGLAAAFMIALIAYGGVTLAAVNSGPESALYGYRLTLEELRIGFAADAEKAYLYLDTAEQRLREIESAAGLGDSVAVARASSAYQEVVRKGVDVLGAVARETQPGTQRTGEVAEDYRRRLAEHDTRFNSLTHSAADAQRAPITRARSLAQAGLQDVHSGPILLAAPTATPDPIPSPTAATPAPVSSPSPTPAALPAPPVSPTPAAPTAAPTAAPAQQAPPEPTAAATPVPAIDITGSAVIITGDLHAVTDEALVVAGITIRRGDVGAVDGVSLTTRVRAEAIVAGNGTLTLVGIAAVQPTPDSSKTQAASQPTATPGSLPSPEPTPADEPPREATPTATPAEGEPTATPESSPTSDSTAPQSTPAPDASPTPTASEGEPTATPDTTPVQETTPAEISPTPTPTDSEPSPTPEASSTAESTPTEGAAPTPEASPTPAEPSPTPTAADGAPSPTPEATLSPESSPVVSTPTPTAEAQATPEPPATPAPQEGESTPVPEVTPTPSSTPTEAPPSPTPSEAEPTLSPEATPGPESAPTETPPPEPAPTASPAPTEPPTTPEPTPTPDAASPAEPLPPTLQGVLVSIGSFSVRAGGIVFSRPLDTPLVLRGPLAPGDVVLVTFEALHAASSYVLVAREVAPAGPPDGPVVTRWQGFVSDVGADAFTLNGIRVQVPPEAREEDVWAGLEAGALVEIELNAVAGEPVAAALRLLESGAAQSFSNLAGPPLG